jgi:hypothetical protein
MDARRDRILSGAILVAALACGCSNATPSIEERRSAVTSDFWPGIIVPAYWTDSTHDTDFANVEQSVAWGAIVNAGCDYTGTIDPTTGSCAIGGGPGPQTDSYIQSKIKELHAWGKHVYGYVWTGGIPVPTPTRPATAYRSTYDIMYDIWYWYQYSVAAGGGSDALLDGIFLDGADRSETSVGAVQQAEWIALYVAQNTTFQDGQLHGWGQSIFNWGRFPDSQNMMPSYMMPYLDCTLVDMSYDSQQGGIAGWNRYVVRETAAPNFAGSLPSWARGRYYPDHFIAIVHDSSSAATDVPGIITTAVNWNAGNVYITNQPGYDSLANSTVWTEEQNDTWGNSFEYPYGASNWDQDNLSTYTSGQCPPVDRDNPPTPTFP